MQRLRFCVEILASLRNTWAIEKKKFHRHFSRRPVSLIPEVTASSFALMSLFAGFPAKGKSCGMGSRISSALLFFSKVCYCFARALHISTTRQLPVCGLFEQTPRACRLVLSASFEEECEFGTYQARSFFVTFIYIPTGVGFRLILQQFEI